jgi:hypothetical protein
MRLTFTVSEDIMQVGLDRMAEVLGLLQPSALPSPVTAVRPRKGVHVAQIAGEMASLSVGCVC